jgi:soluble lytic murein transglycosylase
MTDKEIIEMLKPIVLKYAEPYNVPVALVFAVIKQESGGNLDATGPTGDYGLMQITKPALDEFNFKTGNIYRLSDMFKPECNIQVGTWYLQWCKRVLGKVGWDKVAQAYNAGVGRVINGSTTGAEYARKVTQYYNDFEELLKNA